MSIKLTQSSLFDSDSDDAHKQFKSKPIKWHGGKSYLAKWILSEFPSRESYTHYTEAFAGGLSVLLTHDPTGKGEAVNDINGPLINFWSVLRDPGLFTKFSRLVNCSPFSQELFEDACVPNVDDDEATKAWKFFMRYRLSRQGLGTDYATPTRRTRAGMTEHVSAYLTAVDGLPEAHQRLRRVEIRNMQALKFLRRYDHAKAVHYLDPPYVHQTRTATSAYEFEMTTDHHQMLLDFLVSVEGRFVLSGYRSNLYDAWADRHGFRRLEKEIDNKASSAKTKNKKTECLWVNY